MVEKRKRMKRAARVAAEKKIRVDASKLFVCFRLPEALRSELTKLARKMGSDEDVDHMTLLYSPEAPASDEQKIEVVDAISELLKQSPPLDGKLQGWAYFDGAKGLNGTINSALVALIHSPMLTDLHVAMKGALVECGFKGEKQLHPFVPHTTIAYLPLGKRVDDLPVLDHKFKIGELDVVHSDIHRVAFKTGKVSRHTAKAITASALDSGGKLEPAPLPGGSKVRPKKPPKTRVVEVEDADQPLRKIKDVDTYNPRNVEDDVLRDDFRIVLAWFATWSKDKNFAHDKPTLDKLMRAILAEAVRRGPGTITFNPAGMAESVRDFFMGHARAVAIPQKQFKRLALQPDSEPGEMTDQELRQAHWQLHKMFGASDDTKGDWDLEAVVNLHALVTDELFDRGTRHPPPPDNGLDARSDDFERNFGKQPRWDVPPDAVEKRQVAVVKSDGEPGSIVYLDDVLSHLKSFRTRLPVVYLVGDLANHGQTKGDIDILIRGAGLGPGVRKVIESRIGRALPLEMAERLSFHYDDTRSLPAFNRVGLFDLVFERTEHNEVKEMRADDEDEAVVLALSKRELAYTGYEPEEGSNHVDADQEG